MIDTVTIKFYQIHVTDNFMYLIVKHVHVFLVIVSIVLFQFRYWRHRYFNIQAKRLIKVIPHVIDTLLLTTGIGLAWTAGFSPGNSDWLLFKLLALLIYIVMGYLAMKKTAMMQWSAYLIASISVLYMLLVATSKQPCPFS